MAIAETLKNMVLVPYDLVKGTLLFFKGALSESDGSPSASRLIMMIFSLATVRVMFMVAHHLVGITDATTLGIWLANLPILVGAVIGLITAPYLVNKGSASLSDVVGLVSSIKNKPQQ